MKSWIILFSFVGLTGVSAQNIEPDSTIHEILEEMPRFPGCEQIDSTLAYKNQCAQQQLLTFVNKSIVYPAEARQSGSEGMVVTKFVVERDGSISNPQILKDVDGGCGLEVLRVINTMNQIGIRWIPGKVEGEPVRAYFTLPVRFKLEEAPPFVMIEGDSIWTTFDTPLAYEGGIEALQAFLDEKLAYPDSGSDSCLIGDIEVKLKIDRDGTVEVLELVDLNNLGFDFWMAATDAVTSTIGKWKIATFEGKNVPTAIDLTLPFRPSAEACQERVTSYGEAVELANAGIQQYNEGDEEGGLAKLTEVIEAWPDRPEFLFMRGQAFLNQNSFVEACADLTKAQEIALVNWYDNVLPIICAQREEGK